MTRKICVVTGTRAEYGLLAWIMHLIRDDTELELQIIATGMHLSPEFGLTYRQIEEDGFRVDRKVEMLVSSDTPVGIAKSMGLGMIGMADALNDLRPDLLVILGDRFEIFTAVAAALVARIPVAHLHGGEKTEGAFDEALRHAITKMSHLHFVAAEEYRGRVIQLGEAPERVHLVGGLGLDNICRLKLLDRTTLEQTLDCRLGEKSLLITFHPATLENGTAADQMAELLAALEPLRDTRLLFTLPNADTAGRELIQMVHGFVAAHDTPAPTLPWANCAIYPAWLRSMAWLGTLPVASSKFPPFVREPSTSATGSEADCGRPASSIANRSARTSPALWLRSTIRSSRKASPAWRIRTVQGALASGWWRF